MHVQAEQRPVRGAPRPRSVVQAWSISVDEALVATGTNRAQGLSEDEAQARLIAVGPNDVRVERDPPLWRSVATQLRETMILVLLAALALTLVAGDLADASVIALVVVLNTTMGVVQERRAPLPG